VSSTRFTKSTEVLNTAQRLAVHILKLRELEVSYSPYVTLRFVTSLRPRNSKKKIISIVNLKCIMNLFFIAPTIDHVNINRILRHEMFFLQRTRILWNNRYRKILLLSGYMNYEL
jgi:hypothetical protein